MKKFILFAHVYACFALAAPCELSAQDTLSSYPNYVVIGAFAIHNNAINFTGDANRHSFPAKFEMNPNRNLYYVYVLTTDDRAYAIDEALKLRTDTKYFDTWVYSGPLGLNAVAGAGPGVDVNPETGREIPRVNRPQLRTEPGSGTLTTGEEIVDAPSGLNANTNRSGISRARTADNADNNVSVRPQTNHSTTGRDGEETQRLNEGSPREGSRPGTVTSKEEIVDDPSIQNTQTDRSGISGTRTPDNADKNAAARVESNRATTGRDGTAGGRLNYGQPSIESRQGTATSKEELPVESSTVNTNTPRSGSRTDGQTVESSNNTDRGTIEPTRVTSAGNGDKTSTKTDAVARNQANPQQSSGEGEVYGPQMPLAGTENQKTDFGPPPVKASTEPLTAEEVVGKNFYFHVFRADNHKMIAGEVDAIDFEKSRKMATYQANAPVKVIMPSGKTKQISFITQVFGYRKHQIEFDPTNPSDDFYLDDGGNLVIPFELMRLQKGDIAIMYNVFFFKDAAVMRPESRYEVNNLLELLVENPSYRIKIHGHTNGNASGKIIRKNVPENYYSLSGTKQGFGSAKTLSEERAIVIRDFLISSGISADRMEVKAWGGKKPIHDKHSVRANENVRVEIEILSD